MRRSSEGYRVVGELANTDEIMCQTFWIGVYPGMTNEKIDYMVKIIHDAIYDEPLLKRGLVLAMEFEMLYLKNKCDFYQEMELEDRGRLEMLEQRYESAKDELNRK